MSLNRIATITIGLWALLCGTEHPLQAQQQDLNVTAATQAALRYIRDDLRRSQGIAPQSLVVNSRMLPGRNRQKTAGDAVPLAPLASSVGLKSGSEARHIACESGPGSCRLKDASAFVAISPPLLEGDSARFIVSVETEYRERLEREVFELVVCRSQQGWTVIRKVGSSVT